MLRDAVWAANTLWNRTPEAMMVPGYERTTTIR